MGLDIVNEIKRYLRLKSKKKTKKISFFIAVKNFGFIHESSFFDLFISFPFILILKSRENWCHTNIIDEP